MNPPCWLVLLFYKQKQLFARYYHYLCVAKKNQVFFFFVRSKERAIYVPIQGCITYSITSIISQSCILFVETGEWFRGNNVHYGGEKWGENAHGWIEICYAPLPTPKQHLHCVCERKKFFLLIFLPALFIWFYIDVNSFYGVSFFWFSVFW